MQFAKKKYDGNFFINIEESKNVHLFFFDKNVYRLSGIFIPK